MAWNGSGTYVLPSAYTPAVNGTIIDAADYNGALNDIATGISTCLAADGQKAATGNIPMGNFKFTGLAAPSNDGDSLAWGKKANLGQTTTPIVAVSASAIDCSTGNYFYKTATGGLTWTFTNAPTTGQAYGFILELINGGLGSQVWPASVKWQYGTAPTLQSSATDILFFLTRDGGTTWRASLAIANTVT